MISEINLEGAKISLVVTDPWDFVTAHGGKPFDATILKVKPDSDLTLDGTILMRLDSPILHEGVRCEFFIGAPRHQEDSIALLAVGSELLCGLTHIPEDQVFYKDPFDLSGWRGGIRLIGTLRVKQGKED